MFVHFIVCYFPVKKHILGKQFKYDIKLSKIIPGEENRKDRVLLLSGYCYCYICFNVLLNNSFLFWVTMRGFQLLFLIIAFISSSCFSVFYHRDYHVSYTELSYKGHVITLLIFGWGFMILKFVFIINLFLNLPPNLSVLHHYYFRLFSLYLLYYFIEEVEKVLPLEFFK
jgi:hypothetical protein